MKRLNRVNVLRTLLILIAAGLPQSKARATSLLAQGEMPLPGNSTSTSAPSEAVPVPQQLETPLPQSAPESAQGSESTAEPVEKRDSLETQKRRSVRKSRNQKFAILTPAPASLAGKNLPYGVGLGWRQKVNNESDLLTGLRSNQLSTGLTWESQIFIPYMKESPLLNMFGLGFAVDFDFPYQVVGRDDIAGETQTLEWSALGFQVFPTAQTYLQKGSLSRVWLHPLGYAYRSSKLKVNTGTEKGELSLTLVRRGNFSVFGGEYSFFPYFHTGGELIWGWGQTWEAEDTGTSEKRSGEWNYFEPRLTFALRYPTRKTFVSIFNLSLVTGVSIEFFKSKSPDFTFPGRKTAGLLGLKFGWQFQPPTSPISASAR